MSNDCKLLQFSRIHSAAASVQCLFIVKILNKLRVLSGSKVNLKIGFIGCGRLGTVILRSLLSRGGVDPSDVTVSLRCPSALAEFSKKDVQVLYNNHQVAVSSDMLLLCCLPSQLNNIADDVKGCISPNCFLVSFLAGVSTGRVKYMLNCSNVIRCPQLQMSMEDLCQTRCTFDAVTNFDDRDLFEVLSPVKASSVSGSCRWVFEFHSLLRNLWKHWHQSNDKDERTVDCELFGQVSTLHGSPNSVETLEENFQDWSPHFINLFCSLNL